MEPVLYPTLDALGVSVLERGWLSSNCTVIRHADAAWVIDTGYGAHADQTVKLVEGLLGPQPLTGIINTHLHSDHCGGNAALAARYPGLAIAIPPGQAHSVRAWDEVALTYQPTGQRCPRFAHTEVIQPGTEVMLGLARWQVVAAPGHDPHAVLLYQPDRGVLIAGDALWENGFGVVFPELEGQDAFDEVRATLGMIEALQPSIVVPGHGRPFADVPAALQRARARLAYFISQPDKHAEYAAKVLVKFHLLEHQRVTLDALQAWHAQTPYFAQVRQTHPDVDLSLGSLVEKLLAAQAAVRSGQWLIDN